MFFPVFGNAKLFNYRRWRPSEKPLETVNFTVMTDQLGIVKITPRMIFPELRNHGHLRRM